jgi:hypothetical protein
VSLSVVISEEVVVVPLIPRHRRTAKSITIGSSPILVLRTGWISYLSGFRSLALKLPGGGGNTWACLAVLPHPDPLRQNRESRTIEEKGFAGRSPLLLSANHGYFGYFI